MRTTTMSVSAALSAAFLAAALTPTVAQAAPDSSPAAPRTTSSSVDRHKLGKQNEAKTYWTKDRMKRAIDRTKKNPPKQSKSKAPAKGAPITIQSDTPQRYATPQTPKPTIGKVFFTLGGTDYVCSANSVTAQNKSVVSTAGHCVNEGPGAFAERFVFVPAYQNGNAPYGQWAGTYAYTPYQWSGNGDMNYDAAFVVVEQHNGQSLGNVVGGTGIAFNQPRGQYYTSFGYPAGAPFNGQTLQSCYGKAANDPVAGSSRLSQGIPCDMTGGSSGGPWFLGYGYNATSSVQNSVNSYGYPSLGDYMFGPYFGTALQSSYTSASTDFGY